ncbi:MAG TPA: glutathione peroxidase [Bacteriovoracaceae bacterium]|nr:glutathione peroxidase [Bacteriovoracaceae bacterium]
MKESIYDIPVITIDGQNTTLEKFKDKTMLIVNVASKCGFTPQYEGLEKLYKSFNDKLVVLGFPCNQFGSQEPGDENEIKNFCSLNYNVSFPIFSKVDVNGDNASPLYKYLKKKAPGVLGTEFIKWNFTKFLVLPNEKEIKRFSPQDKPEDLEEIIRQIN